MLAGCEAGGPEASLVMGRAEDRACRAWQQCCEGAVRGHSPALTYLRLHQVGAERAQDGRGEVLRSCACCLLLVACCW